MQILKFYHRRLLAEAIRSTMEACALEDEEGGPSSATHCNSYTFGNIYLSFRADKTFAQVERENKSDLVFKEFRQKFGEEMNKIVVNVFCETQPGGKWIQFSAEDIVC